MSLPASHPDRPEAPGPDDSRPVPRSWLDHVILFCLERKHVVFLALLVLVGWGLACAPFDWSLGSLPRTPMAVDALPDIGENQQIVYVEWPGRSPQDVENQATYPLTAALLGAPGVKTIRSSSMFGFASIYVVFNDDADFYWSRARILEKLASLPAGLLPEGVKPQLGPDATALGQVFWYVLEGRDQQGRPTGGWDPHELRTVQDFQVRYALSAVEGVAEVAAVGGFTREYQVDVNPDLLRAYDVTLEDVAAAVKNANLDVGARTIEVNRVEYLVRGLGFIKKIEDVENAVVKTRNGVPVYVRNVATVAFGPAQRSGALDKDGREAVGGVVVVRHGENPMAVIQRVKERIERIGPSLPKRTLPGGTLSQVAVVPFYDRTSLIQETLSTLDSALIDEALTTCLVILVTVAHLGSSLLVASVLPLAVLLCFIAMKLFGVDANIVALAGIAIAIGALDDMGIIFTENILRHLKAADPRESRLRVVYRAAREVGPAVVAAGATTVLSFLPVFAMLGPEGKLFRPLAFTKTFTLLASVVVAVTVIPPAAHLLLASRGKWKLRPVVFELCLYAGAALAFFVNRWLGLTLAVVGLYKLAERRLPERFRAELPRIANWLAVLGVALVLAWHWSPLGPQKGLLRNLIFAGAVLGGFLVFFQLFLRAYPRVLRWALDNKAAFLAIPSSLVVLGGLIWLGAPTLLGWAPRIVHDSAPYRVLAETFPGLSREFMPPLDEGSFLFMPSTMPHASVTEALDILRSQDAAISAIPEVAGVTGKLGRAETALDPAPLSMIETVIAYHPEFVSDEQGRPLRFRCDPEAVDLACDLRGRPLAAPDGKGYLVRGKFERGEDGRPVPDPDGEPFRLWRPALDPALNPGRAAWAGVRGPDDVWELIAAAARLPGVTAAPRLQPISARLVMLQSGIRASLAVEVKGPSLDAIQKASEAFESALRELKSVDPLTVVADRVLAKPYLEIDIDRERAAQYGLSVQAVQDSIETALGGRIATTTVEGRERYPVRVRYQRELRDSLEDVDRLLLTGAGKARIPLGQVATIRYVPGPMVIKTENAFLTGYVLFDKKRGFTDLDAVEEAAGVLAERIGSGRLELPEGVSWSFAGTYENQMRAEARLKVILPLTLALIFLILYFQFGALSTTLMVFSGVAMAWAGGFIAMWLWGRPWFMDFSVFGEGLRDLFQMGPVNLSLAVWVGFLALFGVATDDGIVMATYLDDLFAEKNPQDAEAVRQTTLEAGLKRVRPCLMTTATTILALTPVLGSRGRGSDILAPMAIPSFGGMLFVIVTMLIVPVLYCGWRELRLRRDARV